MLKDYTIERVLLNGKVEYDVYELIDRRKDLVAHFSTKADAEAAIKPGEDLPEPESPIVRSFWRARFALVDDDDGGHRKRRQRVRDLRAMMRKATQF